MADLNADYRLILKREYQTRVLRNPRYSQNAFAKFLGIDSTYLSKLLKGKILLSLDLAEKITKKLDLAHEERRIFILSAADEQQCHALYLLDSSLTKCPPEKDAENRAPQTRKKKSS